MLILINNYLLLSQMHFFGPGSDYMYIVYANVYILRTKNTTNKRKKCVKMWEKYIVIHKCSVQSYKVTI